MGISGSQSALMYALSGVARAGATRAGYTSPKVFVSVNGVQYGTGRSVDANKVLAESLSVTEVLNDVPNTAAFTMKGAEPAEGQDVVITLGSMNNLDRLFGGVVLNRSHGYVGTPTNWNAPVNAVDYTWHLTRRLFSGLYTSVAPATVAAAIVAIVPGFTVQVEAGLATLDTISFTNVTALEAFSQLAKRIGGYCDVDYHKVVKLFTTDTSVTNPLTLTSTHLSLTDFSVRYDLSPVRTRVFSEGGGTTAFDAAAVGATVLKVVDAAGWYNAAGGTVAIGQQRVTYTASGFGYVPPIINQQIQTASNAINWERVVWAPELSLYVAVAGNVSAVAVMTSPDGVTWTARTPAVNATWQGLAWSPTLLLLVAVSSGGDIMTSPDGITWTTRTSPEANGWTSVCWSSFLSLFVMIGNSGVHRVQTSPDGITWTSQTAASASVWQDVISADALGLLVATHITGGNAIATSPDGVTWTTRTTPTLAGQGLAYSSTLGLLVAVGGFTTPIGYVVTSPDGITWTARTPANNNNWKRVLWIAELGVFLACSSDGAGTTGRRMMSSADGVTWVDYSTPTVGAWWSIAWAPTLNQIVAVGITGGAAVMTSTLVRYRTLTGIPASGAGAIVYAVQRGDPVNLVVQCDDASAQTALAALIGGTDDGIVEDYIRDGRIGETEARARGVAELARVSTTRVTINYKVRDKNTHAGSAIAVSLGSPTSVAATFKIQHVTVDTFQPALMPTYTVEASNDRFSLDDLLRLIRLRLP